MYYNSSCKKWAINSRNETLMKIIKKEGVRGLQNYRICGRHFEDSMYNNKDRLITYLIINSLPIVMFIIIEIKLL